MHNICRSRARSWWILPFLLAGILAATPTSQAAPQTQATNSQDAHSCHLTGGRK